MGGADPADNSTMSVYDELPDKSIVAVVNEIFYEKVFDHPWLGRYFDGVPKEHIRQQQTDFIVSAIGGPNAYFGKPARAAHGHLFITNELFEVRQTLLKEALDEAGAPEVLKTKWLRIDEGFRRGMVKDSVDECTKRYATDWIRAFDPPASVGASRW